MDVYRQASEIVRAVRAGNGTAKALCLRKEMQKKKQTYAVVCETLRHYELLQDVLAQAEFFEYYPRANRDFAVCMAYDVVLGRGVNTNRDSTAQAIQKSAPYLREAYGRVKKHHIIPPRAGELVNDEEERENETEANVGVNCRAVNGGASAAGGARPCKSGHHDRAAVRRPSSGQEDASAASLERRIPRYARVNTLKLDVESLVERLRRAAGKRGREEGEGADVGTGAAEAEAGATNRCGRSQRKNARGLPSFTIDPIVPSLLVFPPGTDLHAHPAVRSGQLVLQDRASCLPACILLGSVEVQTFCSSCDRKGSKGSGRTVKSCNCRAGVGGDTPALEYIVDACAAPGNKTTQLAALGAPHVKIMAIERDEGRAELLRRRVQSLGAADYVNVVHMDFLQMCSADREATEGILLDPSCSASGVVTRVDVALLRKRQSDQQRGFASSGEAEGAGEGETGTFSAEETGVNFASNAERVMSLSRMQRKLLAHALLSFDNCRTVVYSTCSVHEAENEDVVRQALGDTRVQARGWSLSHIMPSTWKTRGRRNATDTFPLERTIRCDPIEDATNGFFVARFDRRLDTQGTPTGKDARK
ncbi:hypothetical protein TRVL_07036 [Trypanosoma vivax]|nr:hypothetical protein TRVL_07036 [Trypanosoma vivax]